MIKDAGAVSFLLQLLVAFAAMGPKAKGKKAKGETEEEKLAREEEERKQRDAEAKRVADEAEKLRVETLRIQTEKRAFRSAELENLEKEHIKLLDKLSEIDSKLVAEIAHEVAAHNHFSRSFE